MHSDPSIGYYVKTPAVSRRERVTVKSFSLVVACVIHIFAFIGVGWIIDNWAPKFEVTVSWSDEPLSGFGFGTLESVADSSSDGDSRETSAVDPDDDPFDEREALAAEEPTLDPSTIEAESTPKEDTRPAYDLARDPKRLEETRADVASIPKLQGLAPGNARLVVLIRNDRVAGSRFESSIRRLFRAFPDYQFALGASQIDPIRDIRAMLIATANPKFYAETFLAVAHSIPEAQLKKSIDSSFPTHLIWSSYENRPLATPDNNDGRYARSSGIYKRVLYLADPQMVLFLRPEVLPTLHASPVLDLVKTRDADLEKSPTPNPTFLQALGGMENSDSASAPTLFFMLQGIDGLRLGRRFPEFNPPRAVTASLSTADRPHLNLEAVFHSQEEAKYFIEIWPKIVSAASNIGIPGVGALLNGLALTDDHENILVSGDLNGAMISLILMFAANYLEKNSG